MPVAIVLKDLPPSVETEYATTGDPFTAGEPWTEIVAVVGVLANRAATSAATLGIGTAAAVALILGPVPTPFVACTWKM